MIRISRRYHQAISICVLLLSWSIRAEIKATEISTAGELHRIFEAPVDSVEVHLHPGEYHLTPFAIVDSTCGNCEDPNEQIPATAGLVISGNYVRLIGPDDRTAIIYTHAGYGLFFQNCKNGSKTKINRLRFSYSPCYPYFFYHIDLSLFLYPDVCKIQINS